MFSISTAAEQRLQTSPSGKVREPLAASEPRQTEYVTASESSRGQCDGGGSREVIYCRFCEDVGTDGATTGEDGGEGGSVSERRRAKKNDEIKKVSMSNPFTSGEYRNVSVDKEVIVEVKRKLVSVSFV